MKFLKTWQLCLSFWVKYNLVNKQTVNTEKRKKCAEKGRDKKLWNYGNRKPPNAQEALHISCSGVHRESLMFFHLMPWFFASQNRFLYLEIKTAFPRIFVSSTTDSKLSGIFLLSIYLCSPVGLFAQGSLNHYVSISLAQIQNNISKRDGAKNHYRKEVPVRKIQAKAEETWTIRGNRI